MKYLSLFLGLFLFNSCDHARIHEHETVVVHDGYCHEGWHDDHCCVEKKEVKHVDVYHDGHHHH